MKLSLKKEIAVCLAGVTVNFFLSVCFFIIYLILGRDILLKVSAVNLILGIFNLLPAFSFDGGRALEAFLECRYDIVKSEKILNLVSFSTLVPIMITGFIMFIKSGNFTLLMCCVYMLVSYIAK